MRPIRAVVCTALFACSGAFSAAYAAIDANASIVSLRTSCTENNGTVVINNCFADINTLFNWLSNTRKPSASAPLLVEIGPGKFTGFISCVAPGSFSHVTFRGAGINRTTIGRLTLGTGCTELVFSELTVTQQSAGQYAVTILKPGLNTTWKNVFLNGNWEEYGTGGNGAIGKHYWFQSRINGYYQINVDQSWFFGSEIANIQPQVNGENALTVGAGGEAHVYGSNINVTNSSTTAIDLVAVRVSAGGEAHIHGTGIDVISTTVSNITALKAESGGEIHANGAAYNLRAPAGSSTSRIVKDADPQTHVHAPYLWEHIPTLPLTSIQGADMTVIATGTADGRPHIAVYDSNCQSKWYDTSDKACVP